MPTAQDICEAFVSKQLRSILTIFPWTAVFELLYTSCFVSWKVKKTQVAKNKSTTNTGLGAQLSMKHDFATVAPRVFSYAFRSSLGACPFLIMAHPLHFCTESARIVGHSMMHRFLSSFINSLIGAFIRVPMHPLIHIFIHLHRSNFCDRTFCAKPWRTNVFVTILIHASPGWICLFIEMFWPDGPSAAIFLAQWTGWLAGAWNGRRVWNWPFLSDPSPPILKGVSPCSCLISLIFYLAASTPVWLK